MQYLWSTTIIFRLKEKDGIQEKLQKAKDALTRHDSDYAHVKKQVEDIRQQLQSIYNKIPDAYKDGAKGFSHFSTKYAEDPLVKEVESEEGSVEFASESTKTRLQSGDAEQRAISDAGYPIANIPAGVHFYREKQNCLSKMKNVCEAAEQVMQFVIKMSSDKCACCGRSWSTNAEKKLGKNTMKKLSEVLKSSDRSPEEIKRIEDEILGEKSSLDHVDQYWKTMYEHALKMESLKEDLNSKDKERRELKSNVTKLEATVAEENNEIKHLQQLKEVASELDNSVSGVQSLESQVNESKEHVDSALTNLETMDRSYWLRMVDDTSAQYLKDLDEIVGAVSEKQKESFSAFVQSLSAAMEACEERCTSVQTSRDRIRTLQSQQAKMEAETQDQLVRLQQQLTSLHSSQSEKCKLHDEQEALDKRLSECAKTIEEAEKEVPALRKSYEKLKKQRTENAEMYRSNVKEMDERLNRISRDLSNLKDYRERVLQMLQDNPFEKRRALWQEKSKKDDEERTLGDQMRKTEEKLAEAEETMEEHKAMERELSLHSERKQKLKNIESLKSTLKQLRESINDSLELSSRPVEALHGERPATEEELTEYLDQVSQQREHLQQSNAEREGRKSEITNAIKSDKEKLRDAKYKE